jgi:glutamine amidotransferase
MKIVIVGYGMGNIPSIVSAVKHVGNNQVLVSDSIAEHRSADKLRLSGVGDFAQAIKRIR